MKTELIFHKLIKLWRDAENPTFEYLFDQIRGDLTETFTLSRQNVAAERIEDWSWDTAHLSARGRRFLGTQGMFAPKASFGTIIHDGHFQTSVLPHMQTVMESGKPLAETASVRCFGFNLLYHRLLLPEKAVPRPTWLLCCTRGGFLSKLPEADLRLSAMDEQILTMFAAGETAKTIGREINLSYRTVESRLNRLKKQTGAKTLPQLISFLASAGLEKTASITRGPRPL